MHIQALNNLNKCILIIYLLLSVLVYAETDKRIVKQKYEANPSLQEIYTILINNPDKYDFERAGKSMQNMIIEVGDQALPLVKQAILEGDDSIMVYNLFSVLLETKKGKKVAEETALQLLNNNETSYVKINIGIEFIGKLNATQHLRLIETFLKDENESVRISAIISLGIIGDDHSLKVINTHFNENKDYFNNRSTRKIIDTARELLEKKLSLARTPGQSANVINPNVYFYVRSLIIVQQL